MSIKPTRPKSHGVPLKSIVNIAAVALMGLLMPRSMHRQHQYRHQAAPLKEAEPEQQKD